MTTPTIAALVLAARCTLEALSLTLRRGTDATLETADACAALRALAAAWARVLPRLAPDVTPPEWPALDGRRMRVDAPTLANILEHDLGILGPTSADTIDIYADGLRTWGRDAAACEEELDDDPEQGPVSAIGREMDRAFGGAGGTVKHYADGSGAWIPPGYPGSVKVTQANTASAPLACANCERIAEPGEHYHADEDEWLCGACWDMRVGPVGDAEDGPAPYTLSALADDTPLPRGPEPIPLAYREDDMLAVSYSEPIDWPSLLTAPCRIHAGPCACLPDPSAPRADVVLARVYDAIHPESVDIPVAPGPLHDPPPCPHTSHGACSDCAWLPNGKTREEAVREHAERLAAPGPGQAAALDIILSLTGSRIVGR